MAVVAADQVEFVEAALRGAAPAALDASEDDDATDDDDDDDDDDNRPKTCPPKTPALRFCGSAWRLFLCMRCCSKR